MGERTDHALAEQDHGFQHRDDDHAKGRHDDIELPLPRAAARGDTFYRRVHDGDAQRVDPVAPGHQDTLRASGGLVVGRVLGGAARLSSNRCRMPLRSIAPRSASAFADRLGRAGDLDRVAQQLREVGGARQQHAKVLHVGGGQLLRRH